MQQEIEAKFLNVNIEEIRARLTGLGAKCEQPMRLMRRIHFDYPDQRFQKNGHTRRLRVRDEGDKVTVTYKAKNETNYSYELETTVGSYDDMVAIFKAIGLEAFTDQESKRETWEYKNVEVVIDEWPWLHPYIEIEGPDEASIQGVAKELGLDWNNAGFGSVDTAYMAQYKGMKEDDSVGDIPEVKFDMPVPQYFKDREKA
jgi:adenylate cyclase, class 2